MKTSEIEFKALKKKSLRLSIISNALIIIGGILAFRPGLSFSLSLIGTLIIIIAFVIGIRSSAIRASKKYRQLAISEAEVNESLREIVNQFGLGMTIAGLIFVFGLLIAGFFAFYLLSHLWIKAIFFLIALELVTDLRSYVRLVRQ